METRLNELDKIKARAALARKFSGQPTVDSQADVEPLIKALEVAIDAIRSGDTGFPISEVIEKELNTILGGGK